MHLFKHSVAERAKYIPIQVISNAPIVLHIGVGYLFNLHHGHTISVHDDRLIIHHLQLCACTINAPHRPIKANHGPTIQDQIFFHPAPMKPVP